MALAGCAALPPQEPRTPSFADIDTSATRLAKSLAPRLELAQGQTGVLVLPDGPSGFASRVLLARAAERTIDVQTYIWHADATGTMLFEEMRRAALRGVRVRLLLDDANTSGLDPIIALLSSEPNVEVRLFNPFADRAHRLLGFAGDFSRLNRRMHNKSFTVDGQVTLVGGRNIGDEYFDAKAEGNFLDNEVVAVGTAPVQVLSVFDLYWNSVPAWPARELLKGVQPITPEAFEAKLVALRESERAAPYREALRGSTFVRAMMNGELPFDWAPARMVYDDPGKVLHPVGTVELQMLPRLLAAMGRTEQGLDLVSPYFVPDEKMRGMLVALAARGVQVRVLTNSLGSSDAVVVHAGYARHRAELLRGGVRLYELKRQPGARKDDEDDDDHRSFGGSGSSLHAKNIAADRRRAFIGSFNLDPRSEHLNTEMGLVVMSPALASRLTDRLDERLANIAYEVALAQDGRLQWRTHGEPPLDSEPDASGWRRFEDELLQSIPIGEWLL